ncbi:peptidylprolyl isomerase [Flavobacterium sp. '19STA2R22 D10 B1']|uniref:peptidylprolyl isomerase n=1 Tax=Flavobacterium aerium TaxID=3037261 RepID=UPI00278C8469|nr:peptidylprolyl isomerase [Flavobacterium sp. '19STA2R22 D10 B1']
MKIKQLFVGLLISLNIVSYAQESTKEVLFKIDNKPYYTDEFTRVYNKNLDLVKDDSQKDLDQYLELFIGYKLKINKANQLGLQNNAQYINELKSYRNQLSKNYITDAKVTKELIEEAYKRSLKEIRASHILLLVNENATPADTLKIYNEAMNLRKRIINGEDFATVATQYSQDPSVKENKGDLGYFSVFRMVYPFENAAYSTPKGEISKPIRTRFGYHLIKVQDVRDNRGEVTAAHIMVLKPTNNMDNGMEKAKNTIQEIYQKLKQGEDFATLARQFSEDKSSSSKGGTLSRFASGQLSSEEFENVAFSLTKPGEYSAPFESQFGWHIVKLIEKHPVKTMEEMENEIDGKIRKDERSRLITVAQNHKLRQKYSVKTDAKMYAKIVKLVNDKFYNNEWVMPENLKEFDKGLLTVNNKSIAGATFLGYLYSQQRGTNTIKPIGKLVDDLYQKFIDEQLNYYASENLEADYPEFGLVMEEYRDGLLLFDLMEKEIWEKAKTDTIGLKNYYELNTKKYQWNNRVDAVVISSTKSEAINQALKYLKQGKSTDFIKEKLNTNGIVDVMVNAGVFEEGSEALPKSTVMKEGTSKVIKEGDYYYITKVNKVLPAGPKLLDETKGRVINDYQQYLEEKWVSDLKNEFKVAVDKAAFEKVKKQIKK